MKSLTPKQDAYNRSLGVLSNEMKEKFVQLACELSPENLTCDGELPSNQAQSKYRSLMKQWAVLEMQVGRKVTEDEVWKWEVWQ